METAYHYCDLNAFLSIIKNKKLWLSSIDNMNDRLEIKHFYNAFIHRARLLANDETINVFDEFLQIFHRQFPTPYICCFSQQSDVLSQWRAYASDGHGVSLGFDLQSFGFHPNGPFMGVHKGISVGANLVSYQDEDEMREKINAILGLIVEFKDKPEEVKYLKWNEIVHQVRYLCMFTKNKFFSEEHEVRVAHLPMLMTNSNGEHHNFHSISEIKHRIVKNRIASYFELDFSEVKKPIKEVVLGPKFESSEYELKLFLDVHGFNNLPIRHSGASYR